VQRWAGARARKALYQGGQALQQHVRPCGPTTLVLEACPEEVLVLALCLCGDRENWRFREISCRGDRRALAWRPCSRNQLASNGLLSIGHSAVTDPKSCAGCREIEQRPNPPPRVLQEFAHVRHRGNAELVPAHLLSNNPGC